MLIGSGNLTRSGLNSNLEVINWDERSRGSGEFLGVDLLNELRALAGSLPDLPHLTRSLEALASGLGAMKPTGVLVSSLVEQRAMLAEPHAAEPPATSIDVVSPAFAGDSDVLAAEALAPWCGPGTEVRIHTGFEGTRATAAAGGGVLRLSTGLLAGLRATGASVRVHAIPEVDDDGANSGPGSRQTHRPHKGRRVGTGAERVGKLHGARALGQEPRDDAAPRLRSYQASTSSKGSTPLSIRAKPPPPPRVPAVEIANCLLWCRRGHRRGVRPTALTYRRADHHIRRALLMAPWLLQRPTHKAGCADPSADPARGAWW